MSTALQEWLLRLTKQHPQAIDMGLERVALVAANLSLRSFQVPVITVGGTNGKGTCIAALEAIYCHQGYRVASYTSPHLVRFNERIRIHGHPVTDDMLLQAFEQVAHARQGTSLTFFEFTTLAALWIFNRSHVDAIVLEVGLGGRLDAVNIVDADVAVITSIGLDHMDYLGADLNSIAAEKAGIMRCHKPVICGEGVVQKAIVQRAEQLQAPLYGYGEAFELEADTAQWVWRGLNSSYQRIELPLSSSPLNRTAIACAIQAATLLSDILPVSNPALKAGAINRLAGRFSVISENPLQVIDVAHNKPAIEALFKKLHEDYPQAAEVHAVFAMLQNKDILGSIENVREKICTWHLAPLSDDRALSTAELAYLIRTAEPEANIICYQSVREAWQGAQRQQGDKPILAFGSFVLIGALMAELNLSVDE